MKHSLFKTLLVLLASACWAACSENVLPEGVMPTLVVGEASNLTRYTATVSGRVETNDAKVTECGFLYSPKSESDLSLTNPSVLRRSISALSGNVETILTGLEPQTTYYYCMYAISGASSMTSAVRSFTTSIIDPPSLTPVELLGKGYYSISVQSSVQFDGGSPLDEVGFEYKKQGDGGFITQKAEVIGEDNTFVLVLENLQAGTAYEIKAYAKNVAKEKGNSASIMVTTDAILAPKVSTSLAQKGSRSITMKSTVDSNGGSPLTGIGIEFRKQGDIGFTSISASRFDEGSANTFTLQLTEGIQPHTSYEVRAYATNEAKETGYSETVLVTTDDLVEPMVITHEPVEENIGTTSIRMMGGIENAGASVITERGFCYSASNLQPTLSDQVVKVTGDEFEAVIGSLRPGTTYYIRAYAMNMADGEPHVGYGEVRAVKTQADSTVPDAPVTTTLPSVSNPTLAALTTTSFRASSFLFSAGELEVAEVGFCWTAGAKGSPEQAYASHRCVASLSADNSFQAEVKGMEGGKTYHVYAYAINSAGDIAFSYSSEQIEFPKAPEADDIVSPEK